ncbi:MAG: outer rane receptor for Fe3+-dicitrate [Acidobacteriaceae bacterium]|nr:outer rane receptor for Fe3+-dicitrate [Acidobacteriaceae bacterium]
MKTHSVSRWSRLVSVGVFLFFLVLGSTSLLAQQGGSVTGTVQDPRGSVLPNAAVVVKNKATGSTQTAKSDTQGRFTVSGLDAGKYTVEVTVSGFDTARKTEVQVAPGQPQDITVAMTLGDVSQQVTVEAANSGSIAAQLAPMDGLLEARSARTEISTAFIQNFTSPISDFSELLQMAPGTFSVNSNGVGLGDSKTYFRGFADGSYDITFDGIPFEDTNSPTHHSWAFFPSQWIGGVDFDRSPGSASTVGPTPFGGSINLLSKDMPTNQSIRGGVSYGSFNTLLYDGHYDSGNFGGRSHKSNLFLDVHHFTSDGYETFNNQTRNAGALKYQYRFSDDTVLTGFAGVVWLDANTPNLKGPTRAQIAQFGDNYLLQNTDTTQASYNAYNTYHVPTDFEYVGFKTKLGKGWLLDVKPYTYSYYNAQYYANTIKTTGGINAANCLPVKGIRPCAIDKLNSYRKYGETSAISHVSKYGVFRTGLWYEWATTNRYQIPSDPTTAARVDDVLPNFHEQFWTNSYQPFAEYEYHATRKLTLVGGFKYAYYNQSLKQFADNGKTVGFLGGKPFVANSGGYKSYLPSADANYRLKTNWSVYGQFSTGSIIPPSSVFDYNQTPTPANPNPTISVLPKPTSARTFQGGTVLKLKRITLNLDAYYTHFQNAYNTATDTAGETYYVQSGDSVSKGFEGETNLYLAHGLSLYANGTAGTARYVSQSINGVALNNYQRWVANTPANTEALGLTYQQKYFDVGMFNKRIGPMWNDSGSFNQAVPIDPFNVTNAYFNFTIRRGSLFDQTKVRLTVNNLFDQHNITGVNPATATQAFTPNSADTLSLLPGRSVMLSVTFGYSPKR